MTRVPLLTTYPYERDYGDDVLELPSDHDLSIRPGCVARLLASAASSPTFVTVLRIYSDDRLFVAMLDAPALKWFVGVDEVVIAMCREAVEGGVN